MKEMRRRTQRKRKLWRTRLKRRTQWLTRRRTKERPSSESGQIERKQQQTSDEQGWKIDEDEDGRRGDEKETCT